jgi:CHAT domain-containing protein
MRMIFRFVLIFLLLSVPAIWVPGQSIAELVGMNADAFRNELQRNPGIAKEELWRELSERAEAEFEAERYDAALSLAEKAKEVAAKLALPFYLYRSNFQLARIETLRRNYEAADGYFKIARQHLADEGRRVGAGKIPYTTEDGYLFYYMGLMYVHPETPTAEPELALPFLWSSFRFNNFRTSSEFDDPYFATVMQIARVFGMRGNYPAKLLWIEQAKVRLATTGKRRYQNLFELHFEAQDAFRKIDDYQSAQRNLESIKAIFQHLSEKNKIKYLIAAAAFAEEINRPSARNDYWLEAIGISAKADRRTQLVEVYLKQLMKSLEEKNLERARKHIEQIEAERARGGFVFTGNIALAVAQAMVAGYEGRNADSDTYFDNAKKVWKDRGSEWRSGVFIYSWESTLRLFQKDFVKLKTSVTNGLELAEKSNGKELLPFLYLPLAKAHLGLGEIEKAKLANRKALELIEGKRTTESAVISTGIVEGLFEAYQIEAEILVREGRIAEAFEASERLKARWLEDKIAGNRLKKKVRIAPKLEAEIFQASIAILQNPKDAELYEKLSALERKALFSANSSEANPATKVEEMTDQLERVLPDQETAIISFSFTSNGTLNAYVRQKGKPVRFHQLEPTRAAIEELAATTEDKIRNSLFFKQDGKRIFDKLLAPLGLEGVRHLILIPDGALWKIPFQALSGDGKTYLIENKLISYAPSVSVLIRQLQDSPVKRSRFQVYANSQYKNTVLRYADLEAAKLARLFSTAPTLNATLDQFRNTSGSADILHFSMHAEADREQAFNSFLAFRAASGDGRLTVDELLKTQLKKGSLAFVASCATNNVFKGEGLISLAWGLMAAGSTTVISSSWEANDRSAEFFTNTFYKTYRSGASTAESIQTASIAMIRGTDKRNREPLYWAGFSLVGDFR